MSGYVNFRRGAFARTHWSAWPLAALTPLIRAIPVELMREANLMVDREDDKKTPAAAADFLLAEFGAKRAK